MDALNTKPNLAAPDDFYEDLIGLHRDLTEAQRALVNAKLILLKGRCTAAGRIR